MNKHIKLSVLAVVAASSAQAAPTANPFNCTVNVIGTSADVFCPMNAQDGKLLIWPQNLGLAGLEDAEEVPLFTRHGHWMARLQVHKPLYVIVEMDDKDSQVIKVNPSLAETPQQFCVTPVDLLNEKVGTVDAYSSTLDSCSNRCDAAKPTNSQGGPIGGTLTITAPPGQTLGPAACPCIGPTPQDLLAAAVRLTGGSPDPTRALYDKWSHENGCPWTASSISANGNTATCFYRSWSIPVRFRLVADAFLARELRGQQVCSGNDGTVTVCFRPGSTQRQLEALWTKGKGLGSTGMVDVTAKSVGPFVQKSQTGDCLTYEWAKPQAKARR